MAQMNTVKEHRRNTTSAGTTDTCPDLSMDFTKIPYDSSEGSADRVTRWPAAGTTKTSTIAGLPTESRYYVIICGAESVHHTMAARSTKSAQARDG